MRLSTYLPTASLFAVLATSTPTSPSKDKPPFFLLAGDSTTAIQSTGGGGWGTGFLNTTLLPPSHGLNYGHNGATTVSFRSGGDWATVLSQFPTYQAQNYHVYVTLQFGHNDQKPEKNISIADYKSNLGVFIDEVRSSGGEPILITPLTRRGFDTSVSPPKIIENLSAEREATISVAKIKKTKFIDLNLASTKYCNAIGPEASWKYNLINATSEGDRTHLNAWGSVVFGRMVSDLLVEQYGSKKDGGLERWTRRNETLSELLERGVAA
ncbi:putative SGNH hydrolase-type esterase domain, SGNH hydrolase superfamily [Septoria linicola]|nr:putative SGNH hydrolase-type esterase domain, SGNH hydrolase superfamily [Septoria linicola]